MSENQSLKRNGFTAALVNKKEVTHNDYNAVFWFNAAISLCRCTLLLFLCAPLIAGFTTILLELTAPLASNYSFYRLLHLPVWEYPTVPISPPANLLVQSSGHCLPWLFTDHRVQIPRSHSYPTKSFSIPGIAMQSIVYVNHQHPACYWHFTHPLAIKLAGVQLHS